jgi:hypothetical protein
MRQMNACATPPKVALREIIAAKRGERGDRLDAMLPSIEARFDAFDAATPPFRGLNPHAFTAQERDDLEHCYSTPTDARNRLIVAIRESQPESLRGWCPYCWIDHASQTDHYLPRRHFPEYSVHVINLVPICDVCNTAKLEELTTGTNRKVLQVYLDPIPMTRFLYANVVLGSIAPSIEFRLDGSALADQDFARIERHFVKLHLLDRYAAVSNRVLAEAYGFFRHHGPVDTIDEARTVLSRESDRWADIFMTRNHWKAVAFEALASDTMFLSTCV